MLKNLGKVAPGATTLTLLYKAPDNTQSKVFSLFICNRDVGASTYRVAVTNNTSTVANQDYIAYDDAIAAVTTDKIENITLTSNDQIWVYAGNANFSFSAFGEELPIVPNT